ncbi:MAG TPA: BatA domain-containing protein, partial [Tepidisphaeraceae bacterium]
MTSPPSILAAFFVSPWFAAAGALLASIPIIIHILNRRRFKVVRWAAMEYLLQAMRKNRRRLKFEQWVLLAIRCLLIFLMGLALARPLGCESGTLAALGGQRTALHVFVIDNSYSMGYEVTRPNARTHLDQAKIMAKRLIDNLAAGNEEVMVITASAPIDKDRSVDPHAATAKPTYDLQAARGAIDRIEQTAAATDLDGALQLALRTAQEENKVATKRLYVFTDATRSAFEGPGGKSVEALKETGPLLAQQFGKPTLFALGKPGQWNQAVLDVAPAVNLVTTKFSADFVANLKGYGAGPDPVVQWKMNESPVGNARPVKLDLDTQPQSLSGQTITEGGPRVFSVTLAGDDHLKIDNTRWRVVDVASEMKVLIVEGDRGIGALAGSGSYLELALSPPREIDPDNPRSAASGKTDSYVAPESPIGELELANKILSNYRAVFLTNVGQVNPNQADQLKRYVEQGGTLVMFAGPAVNSDNYNQQLTPRGLLPGRLIKTVSSNDNPYHFDFNPKGNLHPFLREFKDQENSGLSTAQIWSYWQL